MHLGIGTKHIVVVVMLATLVEDALIGSIRVIKQHGSGLVMEITGPRVIGSDGEAIKLGNTLRKCTPQLVVIVRFVIYLIMVKKVLVVVISVYVRMKT